MRVLRVSFYSQRTLTPTVAVVRDDDTTDTLDGILRSSRVAGGLALGEIFNVDDGTDLTEAMVLAGQRARLRAETEDHQVTLFFWTVERILPTLPTGASAAYPGPIPLNRDEVVEVIEQVAKHPAYRNQRLGVPTNDATMVVLDKGEVVRDAG